MRDGRGRAAVGVRMRVRAVVAGAALVVAALVSTRVRMVVRALAVGTVLLLVRRRLLDRLLEDAARAITLEGVLGFEPLVPGRT